MTADPPAGACGSSHLSQALAPALGTCRGRASASLADAAWNSSETRSRLPREARPARAPPPAPSSLLSGRRRMLRGGSGGSIQPFTQFMVLARRFGRAGGALGSVSLPPSVRKRAVGPILALPELRSRPSPLPDSGGFSAQGSASPLSHSPAFSSCSRKSLGETPGADPALAVGAGWGAQPCAPPISAARCGGVRLRLLGARGSNPGQGSEQRESSQQGVLTRELLP